LALYHKKKYKEEFESKEKDNPKTPKTNKFECTLRIQKTNKQFSQVYPLPNANRTKPSSALKEAIAISILQN